MAELTARQQQILGFVEAESQAGRPVPTLREIAHRFGFKSHRAAACHLAAIKAKGHIRWEPKKARSLKSTSGLEQFRTHIVDIPIYGSIPAGFAEDRRQEPEGCVSVDLRTIGFTPTRTTFALHVKGDSMVGRHIMPGDIVLIEREEPNDGQVVAALIDGQTTLKTFVRHSGKPYLKSENANYPDLIPAEELHVQGVFKALLRKAER